MTPQTVIRANALFSLGSGAALAAGSPWLARWFDVPAWLLAAVGLGVLAFGASLLVSSQRTTGAQSLLRFAFAADLGWVLGAVILFAAAPSAMSGAGWLALAGATLAVADFALLEGLLLRKGSVAAM